MKSPKFFCGCFEFSNSNVQNAHTLSDICADRIAKIFSRLQLHSENGGEGFRRRMLEGGE